MTEQAPPTGPDLSKGIPLSDLATDTPLLGQVDGQAVILVRHAQGISAVSATCTHYSGPLAEGLVVGGTIRCPWHHACFDLRTGSAIGAPALNSLTCWEVEQSGGRAVVRRQAPPPTRPSAPVNPPASVVIVGAGAAGESAAETLRNEGYTGPVTLIGTDPSVPVDRPNLSKDYLAGNAPEDWIPLRPREWFAEQKIELRTGITVESVDAAARALKLADGSSLKYGALLLATGADPIRLPIPGGERALVLRTLADSRAIIERAKGGGRVVILGASFIGLEAAAALRTRGLDVHIAAPEARPLERVLGAEVGDFIRRLHEEHGVVFHLGGSAQAITDGSVTLSTGEVLKADFVVAGVGVRPSVSLAQQAGLKLDRGIVVNEFLETSAPGIWAAGDVARYPDPRFSGQIRVEHWALAQRQGRAAARNILGRREAFSTVPFFWSQHYDISLNYVGHAEQWDRIEIQGSLDAHDASVVYRLEGKVLAVVTLWRDRLSLQAEAALERGDGAALDRVLRG
ncbi:MAG TPA: FAD-dependent oxidoreductase [Gemmatimonadales bacterium]|nr:FAD-dependent oxidoreductase [Gemmatimonadales bacterium]